MVIPYIDDKDPKTVETMAELILSVLVQVRKK